MSSTILGPREVPFTLYRCLNNPKRLLMELHEPFHLHEPGWYWTPAFQVSPDAWQWPGGLMPCDPNDYTITPLEPQIAALYHPPKAWVELERLTGLSELSLIDLEVLIRLALMERNDRVRERVAAAVALGTEQRIVDQLAEPWRMETPALYRSDDEILPEPVRKRNLERIVPGADGLITLPVKGGRIATCPVWERTEGATNRATVVEDDPYAMDGLARTPLPFSRGREPGRYLVTSLKAGQVVEFDANYHGEDGRARTRWYGVVVSVSDTELVLREAATPLQAFLEAKASTGLSRGR